MHIGYPQILKIEAGDTVTYDTHSKDLYNVIRVTRYNDFGEMLDNEDSQKIFPGVTKYQAADILCKLYSEEKEAKGVIVIEIAKCSPDKNNRIISAKHFVQKKYINFANIVSKVYELSDIKDNHKYFKWYWTEMVPSVINGTGEILVCTVNNKNAGFALLLNKNEEKQICYFYVLEAFWGKNVEELLMERAFNFLGTDKPLISIPIDKLNLFGKFVNKYHWNRSQILEKGQYNNSSREIVFNGKIS